MLKWDSELQQKEFVLQTAQQELKEMRQRAERAEAILRSEHNAFEEKMECLEDNLSRALIAQDEAKVCERKAIDHCQRAVKIFKFKKYKEGYEDAKRGASSRFSLEIGAFLRSHDQETPEGSGVPATVDVTSPSVPSSISMPLERVLR